MTLNRSPWTVVAVALLSACANPTESVPAARAVEALMQADRAFAAETAARGLDGWMSVYAEDAVRMEMGRRAVQGLVAIREVDAGLFADATQRLVWEPIDAGVFADGRHGFSTGWSAVVRVDSVQRVDTLSVGRYLTMWRLDESGKWKVILDTGSADPPPNHEEDD